MGWEGEAVSFAAAAYFTISNRYLFIISCAFGGGGARNQYRKKEYSLFVFMMMMIML
jgi:hypothetical protein